MIARCERKGLSLVALELCTLVRATAEEHYGERVGKEFSPSLVEFITSGALVAAVIEGRRAVSAFRQLAGATTR